MILDDNLTLQEGLDKFYQDNPRQLNIEEKSLTEEVRSFFLSHDVVHVLFGCNISLFGEGSVKIWTLFGTTLGFREHISSYKKANALEISKRFNWIQSSKHLFQLVICAPKLIFRAKKMSKLWPWHDFNPYLNVPIKDIRKEYNIHILN